MTNEPNALARLDQAVALLREARTLEEVKKIRAMAAAAAEYARAEKLGDEALGYANEIRVRAARRAGEMLAAMTEKAKGAATPGSKREGERGKLRAAQGEPRSEPVPTLKEMKISQKQSARWQKIAAIPEETFEAVLHGKTPKQAITETAMARVAAPVKKPNVYIPPEFFDDPKCIRPSVKNVCGDLVKIGDPRAAARLCKAPVSKLDTGQYRMEYLNAARSAAEWLTAFIDEWTKKEK
jgi:hypothetical protein